MPVLGLLHTLERFDATMPALVHAMDSGVDIVSAVRPELLKRARREGLETVRGDFEAAVQEVVDRGADVVMVTCSTMSGLVPSLAPRLDVPLLRVDRPMVEEAVRTASRRLGPIGLVATIESTLGPTTDLLHEVAEEQGVSIEIEQIPVFEAAARVYSDSPEAGWAMVAEAVRERAHGLSAVVFAQMSTAASADLLSDLPVPMFTSTGRGVSGALDLLGRTTGASTSG